MIKKISCFEVKARLAEGDDFMFWDVREEWEFEEQNIGAECIPLNSIPDKLPELSTYYDHEIIVHCKTGDRSRRACKFLQSKGFIDVKSMDGGIEAFLQL